MYFQGKQEIQSWVEIETRLMVISTPASPGFQPIFQQAWWGEGYQHLINLAISLHPEFQWKKEICPHFRPLTLRRRSSESNKQDNEIKTSTTAHTLSRLQ